MPRAYTKSGSVEKYEPSLFSTGSYAFATVGSRDADGNYSITPASGYKEDSNGSYILATYYGGVPYTAKFSVNKIIIYITPYIYWVSTTQPKTARIGITRNGGTTAGDTIHDIITHTPITISFYIYYIDDNRTQKMIYSVVLSETQTEVYDEVNMGTATTMTTIGNGVANPSSGTYNGINWAISFKY